MLIRHYLRTLNWVGYFRCNLPCPCLSLSLMSCLDGLRTRQVCTAPHSWLFKWTGSQAKCMEKRRVAYSDLSYWWLLQPLMRPWHPALSKSLSVGIYEKSSLALLVFPGWPFHNTRHNRQLGGQKVICSALKITITFKLQRSKKISSSVRFKVRYYVFIFWCKGWISFDSNNVRKRYTHTETHN